MIRLFDDFFLSIFWGGGVKASLCTALPMSKSSKNLWNALGTGMRLLGWEPLFFTVVMNDEDLSSHFLLENPNLLFVKQSFLPVDFEDSSENLTLKWLEWKLNLLIILISKCNMKVHAVKWHFCYKGSFK